MIERAIELYSRTFYEIRLHAMNGGLWVDTGLALGSTTEMLVRKPEQFPPSLAVLATTSFSGTFILGRLRCPLLVVASANKHELQFKG